MFKRLIVIIVATSVILSMAYFLVKLGFDINASRIIGTKVTAGSLSFNILKRQINIKNVKIYHPPGFEKGIMTTIPLIQVTFSTLPFQGSRLRVNTLSLEIPQLVVIKNQEGVLNVNKLKFKEYKTYVIVDEFIFSAESVIYIDHTAGPKPTVRGYDVDIYERRYKDLPTAEDMVAKVLGDTLSRTAIKGVVVYGAATAAGISLLGPLGIPIGAGIILTGKDSATTVFHKSYNRVYEAARLAIKSMGDLTFEDKDAGLVKGTVKGVKVTVSMNKLEKNKTASVVSARRLLFPDRQTAAGVLYEISVRLK